MLTLSPYQLQKVIELKALEVDFIIIGGRALQAHGLERETYDLDIFVSRTLGNASKLFDFLSKTSPHGNFTFSIETLCLPQKLIPIPSADAKEIDILTSIGALNFEIAKENSICISYKDTDMFVLGLNELIYSKLVSAASSNSQDAVKRDLGDLKMLQDIFDKQFA